MTSSSRQLRSVLVVVVCVAATIAGVSAQTYPGALRGAVRDPQGVIPGAEVTLVNEDTNAECSAMTNEVGEYALASVLPGTYTVRVSLPGFKTEERKGFRIGMQQSLVLDFMLEVWAISEQITVTGEAPLVERASATEAASLDLFTAQQERHDSRPDQQRDSRTRHSAGCLCAADYWTMRREGASAFSTRICSRISGVTHTTSPFCASRHTNPSRQVLGP